MSVTPQEAQVREAIRRTQEAYTLSGDSRRIDDMVATFTEDGVLETGGAEFQGRDAVRQFLSGVGPGPRQPRDTPFFMRHHLTTVDIQVIGDDEAVGRCYFLVMTAIGLDHSGRYADRYRRVGHDWLIAHRKITLDWASPDSVVGATVAVRRPRPA